MIFLTEILLKVALKTRDIYNPNPHCIIDPFITCNNPFIACNIPKSSNILVLHVIQGSTLTVVRLPGASEMRLRASENGTQLVRSGK